MTTRYMCFEVRFDRGYAQPVIGAGMKLFGCPVSAVRFGPLPDTDIKTVRHDPKLDKVKTALVCPRCDIAAPGDCVVCGKTIDEIHPVDRSYFATSIAESEERANRAEGEIAELEEELDSTRASAQEMRNQRNKLLERLRSTEADIEKMRIARDLARVEQTRSYKRATAVEDLLDRARRLLSVCEFDAPEDLADLELIGDHNTDPDREVSS